jgi:hypothetical protein
MLRVFAVKTDTNRTGVEPAVAGVAGRERAGKDQRSAHSNN